VTICNRIDTVQHSMTSFAPFRYDTLNNVLGPSVRTNLHELRCRIFILGRGGITAQVQPLWPHETHSLVQSAPPLLTNPPLVLYARTGIDRQECRDPYYGFFYKSNNNFKHCTSRTARRRRACASCTRPPPRRRPPCYRRPRRLPPPPPPPPPPFSPSPAAAPF